ncbi:MAG TPA: hypothetical protein PLU71_04275 [Candidatus Dependentiae bacterium]|nr:hypothetical protein [Candidatus Dependentiae bacterium]HRQ63049.1 hypothetical protein [Candidatus Dependentiae bacterium]
MKQYILLFIFSTFYAYGMQEPSEQLSTHRHGLWEQLIHYILPSHQQSVTTSLRPDARLIIPGNHTPNNNHTPDININLYLSQQQAVNTRTDMHPTFNTAISSNAYAQADASNILKGIPSSSSAYMITHKWQIILTGVLTCYTYVCYQVITGNLYLQRTDIWSAWKAPLSLQELCALPDKDLTQALIFAIQNKYINLTDPMDTGAPLAQFMHEIESERIQLEYYQYLHNWIKRTHTTWLFPLNTSKYSTIEQRLDRLAFIKHLFVTWLTEQKIDHQ